MVTNQGLVSRHWLTCDDLDTNDLSRGKEGRVDEVEEKVYNSKVFS